MRFLTFYMARRLLGAVARVLDRRDQRERGRIEAAKQSTMNDWHTHRTPVKGSTSAQHPAITSADVQPETRTL